MPINYRKYPENWLSEIRPAILARAGQDLCAGKQAICEDCGRKNRSTYTVRVPIPHSNEFPDLDSVKEERTTVITIAHLDQDITNNNPENLAALCQACHLKWDRPWNVVKSSITRQKNAGYDILPGVNTDDWRNENMPKKAGKSFNVVLSEDEYRMAEELAAATKTNMSICMRQALMWYYTMKKGNIPTCADGRNCFVPHMHVAPTPAGAPAP